MCPRFHHPNTPSKRCHSKSSFSILDEMASYSHHRCNHHHPAAVAATCSFCGCSCSATSQSADPFLQALASQILQSPAPQHSHFSAHLKSKPQHHHIKQKQLQNDRDHTVISSLFKRIDALEISLHRLSSSNSSLIYCHKSSLLRDVAARTIQIHFRAFLVRRSKTLRNLKDLALIKSAFIKLKSSISDQAYLNSAALSRKAMDFLIELDSIQGGDPMIRDGKRSISRDLVRFLNFIDGVSVKRYEFSTKAVKNVKYVQNNNKSRVLGTECRVPGGKNQRETLDKLRDRVRNIERYARVSENEEEDEEELEEGFHHQGSDDEQHHVKASKYRNNGNSQIINEILSKKHGFQSGSKKCVSFADTENESRILEHNESFSNESEAEDDNETQIESEESDQTSEIEEAPMKNPPDELNDHSQGKNGNLIFSAPVPVKMEARDELARKERLRKIGEVVIDRK